MKNIFLKKCEYNGCKARVYAQGLCYKHFVEQLNIQSDEQKKSVNKFDMIMRIIAVMLVAMLWLCFIAATVLFAVYCNRCVNGSSWKFVIMAIIIIALSYIILRGLLVLFDKSVISKYIFTLVMLVLIFFAVSNITYLYSATTECLKLWAKAFCNGMKGILF